MQLGTLVLMNTQRSVKQCFLRLSLCLHLYPPPAPNPVRLCPKGDNKLQIMEQVYSSKANLHVTLPKRTKKKNQNTQTSVELVALK